MLPDTFTIYRGAKNWNTSGMSWTLDVNQAVYFATTTVKDGAPCSLPSELMGVVMEKTIHKSGPLYSDSRRI